MDRISYARYVVEFYDLPRLTADQLSAVRAHIERASVYLHPPPSAEVDTAVTLQREWPGTKPMPDHRASEPAAVSANTIAAPPTRRTGRRESES
jgi:hypothetical protein